MKIEKVCPCGENFYLTPAQDRPGHGKFCNRECYLKYGNKHIGKISAKAKGKNHWNYKGDNAKYSALHLRVQDRRGKATECEYCGGIEWVEWANMTGRYEDTNDYQQLCRSCHTNYDNQLKSQGVRGGLAL